MPDEVVVECGNKVGVFQKRNATVRCECAECGGRVEMHPREFEVHAGRASNKRWKTSLMAHLGGGKVMHLGKYLNMHGLELITTRGTKTTATTGRLVRLADVPQAGEPSAAPPAAASPHPSKQAEVQALLDSNAKKAEEAVSPIKVLPPEFAVQCAGLRGTFLTKQWCVRCHCAACAGHKTWSPNAWEVHTKPETAGSWQTSVCIEPGALPGVPANTQPVSMRAYLRLLGYKLMASRGKGCIPPLMPIRK